MERQEQSVARTSTQLSQPDRRLQINNRGEYQISLYTDAVASQRDVEDAVAKLCIAYPQESREDTARFFALMAARVIDNGFTRQRLNDAVNNVIDHFKYKNIAISDIIDYDRAVRLYTYGEYTKEVLASIYASEDFAAYGEVDGIMMWYRKSELAKLKGR